MLWMPLIRWYHLINTRNYTYLINVCSHSYSMWYNNINYMHVLYFWITQHAHTLIFMYTQSLAWNIVVSVPDVWLFPYSLRVSLSQAWSGERARCMRLATMLNPALNLGALHFQVAVEHRHLLSLWGWTRPVGSFLDSYLAASAVLSWLLFFYFHTCLLFLQAVLYLCMFWLLCMWGFLFIFVTLVYNTLGLFSFEPLDITVHVFVCEPEHIYSCT